MLKKGSVLVAGNVGYYSKKVQDDLKSNYFEFSPKVGYQFSENNWTVGIEAGIGIFN